MTLDTSGDLWSQALAKPFECCCVQTGVTSCLTLCISFPFPGPAAILGCGFAPLPIRGHRSGDRWAWLILHSVCCPLNPLIPQSLGLPFCPKSDSVLGQSPPHAAGRGGPMCPMPLTSLRSAACSAQQQGHFGVVTPNLSQVITLLEVV